MYSVCTRNFKQAGKRSLYKLKGLAKFWERDYKSVIIKINI